MAVACGRTELTGEVASLLEQITRWRRTRAKKKEAMPEELWAGAVAAAREYGTHAVSRALGVNYETLQVRLLRADLERSNAEANAPGAELGTVQFVELCSSPERSASAREAGVAEVELSGADGATLWMRLTGEATANVMELAHAFWRRSR